MNEPAQTQTAASAPRAQTDAAATARPPSAMPAPGGDFSPFRSLLRHKGIAALASLLVLLAGLPYAWVKGASQYSSTAVIFVSPHFVANLQDGKEIDAKSDNQYHEYLQQNVKTINRFDIVAEALRKLGSRNAAWVKPGEALDHAAERLQRALDIKAVPDTYQIAVSLDNSRPEGLADLVNAVVDTYLERAKSEEFYASDERVKNLSGDRDRILNEIADKQARRVMLAQELGVSSFTDNFVNPYDRLLVEAKEALAAARRQHIDAEAQLAALDEKRRKEGGDALIALAETEAGRDVTLTSLEANQSVRRTQLLTQMSGLSADHPGRRAAERELAELEKEQRAVHERLVRQWSKALLDQRGAEAFKTSQVEQKLSEEVAQQTSQATFFTTKYQDGIQLGVEIEQARKRVDSLQERIDFLSLEKNAPGFVRVFSAARTPDTPSKGGRRKLFLLVLAAALMAGIFTGAVVDIVDTMVRTPRHLAAVTGFPPVAWLLDKRSAGPDFAREQVMRLASRLVQDHQTNGSRIFAFTSVKAGGGTSSIVMETTSAIVHLGLPALAVEANAYRADPRYRGSVSPGLAFVLRGNPDLRQAVVPGDLEMPDHVPLGEVNNQKNLPEIQKLMEILRASEEAYDCVLIDLPPILASVDAEFLARSADVTVLVVEAGAVRKEELRRAAACLERIGVRAVSAVLNRVVLDAGDGFARTALQEFQSGAASRPRSWFGGRANT